ncbi:hypothetical protein BESB_003250 [Besnoitia besnoiti]|uniref:Uncharacterized protein n=1 Tax=Besnoitia besnoiti TaxID=94643 RepID=A0A2A9ML60_BESBE|nr:hypothetical protein BESB_003250 [Besnoitia besnoiti]PFH37984.1 hypothetical protein BESB_003250 [Besnoitia besnoiti]
MVPVPDPSHGSSLLPAGTRCGGSAEFSSAPCLLPSSPSDRVAGLSAAPLPPCKPPPRGSREQAAAAFGSRSQISSEDEGSEEGRPAGLVQPFRFQHHWRSSPSFARLTPSPDVPASPLARFRATPRHASGRGDAPATLVQTAIDRRPSASDGLSGHASPFAACDDGRATVVSPVALPSLAASRCGMYTPVKRGSDAGARWSFSSVVSTEAFSQASYTPSSARMSVLTDPGSLSSLGGRSPAPPPLAGLDHPPSESSADQSPLPARSFCPPSVFAAYAAQAACGDASGWLEEGEESDDEREGVSDDEDLGVDEERSRVEWLGFDPPHAANATLSPQLFPAPRRSPAVFVLPYLREKSAGPHRGRHASLPSFSSPSPLTLPHVPRQAHPARSLVWAPLRSLEAEARCGGRESGRRAALSPRNDTEKRGAETVFPEVQGLRRPASESALAALAKRVEGQQPFTKSGWKVAFLKDAACRNGEAVRFGIPDVRASGHGGRDLPPIQERARAAISTDRVSEGAGADEVGETVAKFRRDSASPAHQLGHDLRGVPPPKRKGKSTARGHGSGILFSCFGR